MMHICCVPDCSNGLDRETALSYFKLPLKKKGLLQRWKHVIGRKHLPLNSSTTICSKHFENTAGQLLRPDEVPTKNLPVRRTSVMKNRSWKSPKQ